MSELKRYDWFRWGMDSWDGGEWVRYADVEARIRTLEAELTQARADARVLAAWHQRRNHADQVWTCSTEEAAALERNKP